MIHRSGGLCTYTNVGSVEVVEHIHGPQDWDQMHVDLPDQLFLLGGTLDISWSG